MTSGSIDTTPFTATTSKPKYKPVQLEPITKSERFTVCAITDLTWPVGIGSISRQRHISQDKRILDIWRTGLRKTKLESLAKSPTIINTHEQVCEASKNTFHPSHNPAPLLAVLYPQFTLEDFGCHFYVNRPAHS
jgi:hypothetical protein